MGGGLALGAGVFAIYFLFGNKRAQQQEAAKSIAQWESAWTKARTCLVGAHPPAADPFDTLAIRALRGDAPSCSYGELGRPEGMSTGVVEIEAAWDDEEKAWHALALAGGAAAMGAQITALDAADRALRKAAGMDDAPAAGPPPPPIALLRAGPAVATTAGVTLDRLETTGHALVGTIDADDVAIELIARGPGDVVLARHRTGVTLSVSDPSWGATEGIGDGDEAVTVSAGPIAHDGTIDRGVVVVKTPQAVRVAGAIGKGAARAVVISTAVKGQQTLEIVRSSDGGAHWGKPEVVPGAWGERAVEDPVDGGLVLSGGPDADAPIWLALRDAAAPTTLVPFGGDPGLTPTCVSGGAIWAVTSASEGLVRVVPGAAATPPIAIDPGFHVATCTKNAAAIVVESEIRRCTEASCDAGLSVPAGLAGGAGGIIDLFDGSGVVYADQAERLIGVWRTGVDPVFVRAPPAMRLIGVAVWNKTPTFALLGADGLHFAPLP